ncbi:hypothetical protein [Rhizobium halophilum]|uniref:hypothetical protein n=1 Tax=Rhizobium halophilum TaxID=2846852 RepID=UPI001EFD339F|nr:hypothetical protein [Rhizobium halophilum]MCF6367245.1 hypothetical protein [Rhizobium halophilum]
MGEGGKITLTIHGLAAFHGEVDGEVFAEKFSAFMRGLASADEAANGERQHKFILTDLRKNTATAELLERQTKTSDDSFSGVAFFVEGVEEIRANSRKARSLPLKFVENVVALNKGVGRRFEVGELKLPHRPPVMLDQFLERRAKQVLEAIRKQGSEVGRFEGVTFGSFDGMLRAVDYQRETKSGVIWLTAGGRPLKCNITAVKLDDITAALEKRAIFFGAAHYDGVKPLPVMLDVTRIRVLDNGMGLARWRGAFDLDNDEQTWSEH